MPAGFCLQRLSHRFPMHISSSPQFPAVLNIGGNRLPDAAAQGEQRDVIVPPAAVAASGSKGPLVRADLDYGKVERIDLSQLRQSKVPLQNQRAVEAYSTTANTGDHGVAVFGAVDLFA